MKSEIIIALETCTKKLQKYPGNMFLLCTKIVLLDNLDKDNDEILKCLEILSSILPDDKIWWRAMLEEARQEKHHLLLKPHSKRLYELEEKAIRKVEFKRLESSGCQRCNGKILFDKVDNIILCQNCGRVAC